jgi:uncharacterized peroxidase-related enzyme
MSYLPSAPNATLLDAYTAYPELAKPLHDLAEALMRGPSALGAGERELIGAYISALNGCAFCRQAHLGAAERFGIDPAVLDELLSNIEGASVAPGLRPLLRYLRKLNAAPAEIAQADVDAVLAAGWDERTLIQAAGVCGLFNLMNRIVEGLGIESDPKTAAMAGRLIYEKGYGGLSEVLEAAR